MLQLEKIYILEKDQNTYNTQGKIFLRSTTSQK